jgi:hypothetical protein
VQSSAGIVAVGLRERLLLILVAIYRCAPLAAVMLMQRSSEMESFSSRNLFHSRELMTEKITNKEDCLPFDLHIFTSHASYERMMDGTLTVATARSEELPTERLM